MRRLGAVLSLMVLMLVACSGNSPEASQPLSKPLSANEQGYAAIEKREPMRMTMFYTGESEHWKGQFIHHSEKGLLFEIYFQMGKSAAIHVSPPQGTITYQIKSADLSLTEKVSLIGNTIKVPTDKLKLPKMDDSIRVEVMWNNQVESFVMTDRMQEAVLSYEEAMRIAEAKLKQNIAIKNYHFVDVSFDPYYLLWEVKGEHNSDVKDYYHVELSALTGDLHYYEWEVQGARYEWSKDGLMDTAGHKR